MKVEIYQSDTIVFKKNDASEKFYFILYGKVRVFVSYKSSKKKKKFFQNFKFKDKFFESIAVISQGSHFGELGLLTSQRRSAGVLTMTDCVFGTIAKENFAQLMTLDKNNFQIGSKLCFMRDILSNYCSYQLVFHISSFFRKLEKSPNSYIFKENENFNKIYIIESGEVVLSQNSKTQNYMKDMVSKYPLLYIKSLRKKLEKQDRREEKFSYMLKKNIKINKKPIGILNSLKCLGLIELNNGKSKYLYTAMSKTKIKLFYIEKDIFRDLINTIPCFNNFYLEKLSSLKSTLEKFKKHKVIYSESCWKR